MKRTAAILTVLAGVLSLAEAAPAGAVIRSWRIILPGNTLSVAVTADPGAGGGSVILAGTGTGIKRSTDGGLTWSQGIFGAINALAVDPGNPAVVYAATSGALLKSTDRGQSWTPLRTGAHYAVAVSPFNPQVLYANSQKSVDGGASWTQMTGLPATVNLSLHIKTSRDPNLPGFMLAAIGEVSYRSDNAGDSWVRLQNDADSVEIDPVDARYYYVGGRCGRSITRFFPITNPDGTPGTGKATNGPSHVHALTVDPTNHSRVFAADEGGTSATSTNFGQSWSTGPSSGEAALGRMIFDSSNGMVLLPTTTGLWVKDSWCTDADNDGYSPAGGVCGTLDCNDADPAVNPGRIENCLDYVDNNCNGAVDLADAHCIDLCSDKDLDGHLSRYCPSGDDCNDWNPLTFLGAPEICDWEDNNCDGQMDEGFDLDADGWTTCNNDCNDNDSFINPIAAEACDGVDNNCDGVVDEWCVGPELAWGDNAKGQLGDGTTTLRKTPVAVPGFMTYLIAAGTNHSLAVPDGSVWAWGDNAKGQLGDATTTARKTPTPVLNEEGYEGFLGGIVALAAGNAHSLAIGGDAIYAWGDNAKGQLGDGTVTSRKRPVRIPNLYYVTAVAAGFNHSLALSVDGSVWAWGDNSRGQLGDGTSVNRTLPVQVLGLADQVVVAVAAGGYFNLALTMNGTVYAWGDNSKGQLGDGTYTPRKTAVPVANLGGVTALAAGYAHSLALSGGSVLAWGENAKGQLGDGTTKSSNKPTAVPGLSGITAIGAGSSHSLAVGTGGVRAWGDNAKGQLGDGTTTVRKITVSAPGTAGVLRVAGGGNHSLAR